MWGQCQLGEHQPTSRANCSKKSTSWARSGDRRTSSSILSDIPRMIVSFDGILRTIGIVWPFWQRRSKQCGKGSSGAMPSGAAMLPAGTPSFRRTSPAPATRYGCHRADGQHRAGGDGLALFDPLLRRAAMIVERHDCSAGGVMLVTMNPTRGWSSLGCHSTFATTCVACSMSRLGN